MARSHLFHLPVSVCKVPAVILACVFAFGLLTGASASDGCRRMLEASREALVPSAGPSVFVPTVLPVLVSGFAVYSGHPVLLIPAAFWKAFFFSCVGSAAVTAWGSAGWLVGGSMIFGSLCVLPVLWWYWLRHIGGEGFSVRTFLPALGAAVLIGSMDFLVISPFLTNILIF